MEIVCIDYHALEPSKRGVENILVITDHFTRYAQAFPTNNQTARTAASLLFYHFIVHYDFPARIHNAQGQCFESNFIKEMSKSRGQHSTIPSEMAGSIKLFFRCSEPWKSLKRVIGKHKSHRLYTRTTFHYSTGYSPYFLMFGSHPRLATDACFGLCPDALAAKTQTEYVRKLTQRLHFATQKASQEAQESAAHHKSLYDLKARSSVLEP